ncbi:MAG: leucine--tRNA ligase [Bacteroidota bacterium]
MAYYDFKTIEQKWQDYWIKQQDFRTLVTQDKPKFYVLDMFPYPSGAGLHVGHTLGYVASDIIARYKRSQGYNVLHPMGFDAFGLPAEQYALQTGQHPAVTTAQNIERYQAQLQRLGLSFDWERTVCTSDPSYYRWTQWIFLQLFHSWYDNHAQRARPIQDLITCLAKEGNSTVQAACDADTPTFTAEAWQQMTDKEQQIILLKYRLAFLEETVVNWCPALGTVLANEEVKGGLSERGGHPVLRKKMQQWSLRITAYATRLLQDLAELDWPTSVKEMQRHWIGMSQGAIITFQGTDAKGTAHALNIFTSRPDTLFGATYLALAPEHPMVQVLTVPKQQIAVKDYVDQVRNRSERDRLSNVKQATGVFTGTYAQHPFTGQPLPIWIADYVVASYGTGAVMGVPAHDSRDYAFAQQLCLPIVQVVTGGDIQQAAHEAPTGKLVNSNFLDGLTVQEATETVLKELIKLKIGGPKTTLRLRNAIFSRQRYWGEPFPIYYQDGVPYTLPEDELPLVLPAVNAYKPTSTGQPPLGHADHWHTATGAPLELNTMPGWAGSSWYFFRYMDPHNEKAFVDPALQAYWQTVDLYMGGAEHATGHLLYARFWTKFLYDLGYVKAKEPFQKLINQGMIQGISSLVYRIKDTQQFVSYHLKQAYDTTPMRVPTHLVNNQVLDTAAFKKWLPGLRDATFILEAGQYICGSEIEKMSKSKHNVINPDEVITQYGADTLRLYVLFLGPLEQSKPWDMQGIDGVSRFLNKLWKLFHDTTGQVVITDAPPPSKILRILHKTIKKVQQAIERYAFNTAVSAFMICVNELTAVSCNHRMVLEDLVLLIAPFAPHIAEELWQHLGHKTSITHAPCPRWNEAYIQEDVFEYPITINGKVRARLSFSTDTPPKELESQVLADALVQKWLQGKSPKKVIIVPQRIINVVV